MVKTAADHARLLRVVADAVDFAERPLVVVSLDDTRHLPGGFENRPHLRRVADARLVLRVELLVDDRHAGTRRGGERCAEELNLLGRQERLLPVEVPARVGRAVGAVAGVQHDERHAAARKRIPPPRAVLAVVRNVGEEFVLCEVVVVVVAEDVVTRALERGKHRLHRVQIGERFGGRTAKVLEVAAFDDEVGTETVHRLRKRAQFIQPFGVAARVAGPIDVCRIMAVGDIAETHDGLFALGTVANGAERHRRTRTAEERPPGDWKIGTSPLRIGTGHL